MAEKPRIQRVRALGSQLAAHRRVPRLGVLLPLLLAGCYSVRPSSGGGEVELGTGRSIEPTAIAVPGEYLIEPVMQGLTFPTAVTFDEQGRICVLEAGYSYGEVFTTARLLRLNPDRSFEVLANGTNGPWTGVAFHGGDFYVSEGGQRYGGRILRVTPQREIKVVVDGLPGLGDHRHFREERPRPPGAHWRALANPQARSSAMNAWLALAFAAACAGCSAELRSAPLVGPFQPKNPVEARGERVFFTFCHQCHPGGASGLGPALNDKPLPEFAMRTQIRVGAGAMPSFSDKDISDSDADAVVEYIVALRAMGK